MKAGLFAASLFLTSALSLPVFAASVTLSPPPVQNKASAQTPSQPKVLPPVMAKPAPQAKADCPCDCPQRAHKAGAKQAAHHPSQRHTAGGGNYRYADAAPVRWHERRAAWRDGASAMAYGPPRFYEPQGLRVDDSGWTGGVGIALESGGGGGFVDGYGQVHFATGGSVENGPTYNGYGQSFQYNPSQAGPFQPRSMGGFAPSSSGSH